MVGFARAAMENGDAFSAAKALKLAKFDLNSKVVNRHFAAPMSKLLESDPEKATQNVAAFKNGWETAEKYVPTEEKLPEIR